MFCLSIGFQNGMSWPYCTKIHKLVWILGNGPFPHQRPVGGAQQAGSPTQQYNFFAAQTVKISVYFMQRIKSYSIFTARQTVIQRHILHPYMHRRDFSIWKFIPFTTLRSFVCSAHSLTLFVKDKLITKLQNLKNLAADLGPVLALFNLGLFHQTMWNLNKLIFLKILNSSRNLHFCRDRKYMCGNTSLFRFLHHRSTSVICCYILYNLKLNPKFHWLCQIVTTLHKFHWKFWIFWMQLPKLKNLQISIKFHWQRGF